VHFSNPAPFIPGVELIAHFFTPAKRQALWFWLADGWHDDESPEARRRAESFIRELAEHAASNGQQITLEMYEDTYLGTCDGAVKFLEEVGHDACGLNPGVHSCASTTAATRSP
jgi:hypothetical protein